MTHSQRREGSRLEGSRQGIGVLCAEHGTCRQYRRAGDRSVATACSQALGIAHMYGASARNSFAPPVRGLTTAILIRRLWGKALLSGR